MKTDVHKRNSRPVVATGSIFTALCRKLRAFAEKVAPVGYEDESGFHVEPGDKVTH